MQKASRVLALPVALVLSLVACGGGDGGTSRASARLDGGSKSNGAAPSAEAGGDQARPASAHVRPTPAAENAPPAPLAATRAPTAPPTPRPASRAQTLPAPTRAPGPTAPAPASAP